MTHRQTMLTVLLLSILFLATPAQAQGPASPSTSRDLGDTGGVTRTFFLENAEVADVMTLLRALVGIRHLAANEEVHAIVVRDTAEKVELAAEVVRAHDQPRDEVAILLELLELPAIGPADRVPGHLTADDLVQLRSSPAARVLARPTLSAVAGKGTELLLGDRVPIDTGDGVVYQEVGLKVAVAPRVHASAAEVTLDFQVEWSHRAAAGGAPGRPVIETRRFVSSARLGDGESYLVTGLSGAGLDTTDGGERAIGLLLTPRIVRRIDAGFQ